MHLNDQFEQVRQSPTVAIADQVQSLIASGRKIIPLHVGDPDLGTPQAVVDKAISALREGLTHYGPSRGFLDLRVVIASKLARLNSNLFSGYNPDCEILVTHGGIHAYYLALQSILNPGDAVLVPDPSWGTHANMVRQLRGTVIPIPARAEDGFIPPMPVWEAAVTTQTRAIVINYPSNPTGAYPDRAYLERLHKFAQENGLWIISDEVYENLYFEGKPDSAIDFADVKEHTLLVNSLSKTYAMTGWRVGYLAGPRQVIDNALKAAQNSITCVAPFVQKAAAFALTDPGVQIAADEMRAVYSHRRQLVMDLALGYGESPVCVVPPKGAFYYFLDLRNLNLSSQEICSQLLDKVGVGVIPGSAFGLEGEGFVRMTFAASNADIENGFRSILDWAGRK